MSEQNEQSEQNAQEQQPVFRLQKMYLKDLSFENPNAPDVFLGKGEPKVDVNLSLKQRKLETPDHYEVILAITANVTNSQTEKTLFVIEVEHAGVFLLKNIPEEHIAPILSVECPSLLFPFTRQIMSQTAVDGGFMPFLMDPVNFAGLFQNAQAQKAGKENQQ